jgi:hypothetical protein
MDQTSLFSSTPCFIREKKTKATMSPDIRLAAAINNNPFECTDTGIDVRTIFADHILFLEACDCRLMLEKVCRDMRGGKQAAIISRLDEHM